MAKVHVKVNDTVYVRCGKDRGHIGKVLRVIPSKHQVIVEGANMVTKHQKPRRANEPGGLVNQENPISASNVMLVAESCKRPTKIGYKTLENGTKIRFAKADGEEISAVKSKQKK